MGDAGELLDAAHPERGLLFAGRLAENFKLSSGTWVHVGELRLKLLEALGALALDVIVAGHDRDAVGALLIPKPGVEVASALPELERRLRAFAAQHPQQSKSVRRAAFTLSPLSIDGGEITDKGYVNQRACLLRRADEVEALFAVTPDSERVVAL
jgi:feruloyl-CoA synthase